MFEIAETGCATISLVKLFKPALSVWKDSPNSNRGYLAAVVMAFCISMYKKLLPGANVNPDANTNAEARTPIRVNFCGIRRVSLA